MAFWTPCRLALAVSVPALMFACSSTDSSVGYASGGGSSSGSAFPSASAGFPGDGGPSEYPILAPVDTGATMTAAPGKGVGVFTEYLGQGNWNLWWTCDSLVDSTNPPCQFDVKVSVTTGSITSVTPQGLQSTDTLSVQGTQVEAVTTTSTASDGITFQTAPGATITLSASVAGQYDGRFIFFVEGGKVDDGFTGTVTDPILLQGSTP